MATLYSSMISARSRRLRTIGLVLLGFVLSLSLYGGLVFMPRLRENRMVLRAQITHQPLNSPPIPFDQLTPQQKTKLQRLAKAQFIFQFGYWSICGSLIILLLIIAWLDAREVAKNYLRLQITLLAGSSKSSTVISTTEIEN